MPNAHKTWKSELVEAPQGRSWDPFGGLFERSCCPGVVQSLKNHELERYLEKNEKMDRFLKPWTPENSDYSWEVFNFLM